MTMKFFTVTFIAFLLLIGANGLFVHEIFFNTLPKLNSHVEKSKIHDDFALDPRFTGARGKRMNENFYPYDRRK